MYNFKKMIALLALFLVSIGAAEASSWDEDNAPPAGSLVNPDYTPAVKHKGFYLGIEGGGTSLNNQTVSKDSINASLKSKLGYNGGISFGYDYALLRIEEEINAANNSADTLSITGFPSFNVSGRTTSVNAMTNLILNLRRDTGFGVFAGAGIGGSGINYDYQPAKSSGLDKTTSTWKGAFSGQLLAGVAYAFNHMVELDLEYRYLNAWVQGGNDFPSKYTTNNVDLGLKFFLS